MITTFGGGVGAGKFLEGLYSQIKNEDLNIIVNTADDIDIYGVRVSPDVDSILYWLSGIVDKKRGWGIKGDSFNHLLTKNSDDSWFNLGDKDLKENLKKMSFFKKGLSLEEVIDKQRKKLKIIKAKIYPMTNQKVETFIKTKKSKIHFQEYLIKYKMRPKIEGVTFRNIRKALPPKGIIKKIKNSKLIIFCPSNPIISVNPILSVPGVKDAVLASKAIKVAISPIVGRKAFKGPVLKFMKTKNLQASPYGIASFYKNIIDYMMLDDSDAKYIKKIESLKIAPILNNINMSNKTVSINMSKKILRLIEK